MYKTRYSQARMSHVASVCALIHAECVICILAGDEADHSRTHTPPGAHPKREEKKKAEEEEASHLSLSQNFQSGARDDAPENIAFGNRWGRSAGWVGSGCVLMFIIISHAQTHFFRIPRISNSRLFRPCAR
jgi:hypothetical protein